MHNVKLESTEILETSIFWDILIHVMMLLESLNAPFT